MSRLVFNRDGGKTDELGHLLGLSRFFQGEVIDGLLVSANGTPNMTVNVAYGVAAIPTGTGATAYKYYVGVDTSGTGESVAIPTANGSNPRNDMVVAYVDKSVTPNTTVTNNSNNMLKLTVVSGVAATTPADPSGATIQAAVGAANPYIILARVRTNAAVSQITSANITDLRSLVNVPRVADNSISLASMQDNSVGASELVNAAIEITKLTNNALAVLAPLDFVISGYAITVTSGLGISLAAGSAYVNKKYVVSAGAQTTTLTANRDAYIDVDANGVMQVTQVTNGNQVGMTLAAGYKRLGMVVTGASVTRIEQVGYDPLGNRYYNTVCADPTNISATGTGTPWLDAASDSRNVMIRWKKPSDIMTIGTGQIVRVQTYFHAAGGNGNVVLYRRSYRFRRGTTFSTLEASSGVTAGMTPNISTINMPNDTIVTDFWMTYDMAAWVFDDILRVDVMRDGAGAGDTNPAGVELDDVFMFYNKDYSKD